MAESTLSKFKRSKAKFNAVDFLIIVGVIAAVLVLVFRATIADFVGNSVYREKAEITFVIQNADKSTAEKIKEGDVFYLENLKLGEVLGVSFVYSTVCVLDKSGESPIFKEITDEQHYDITVKVSSAGAYFEDGFYLGGENHLGVGQKIAVFSENFESEALITAIS